MIVYDLYLVADENKIQGYVPLYNIWVIKHLAPEHVGTTESDVVSNMVLQWFNDNQRLLRALRLTPADYVKATKKKGGPKRIVPHRPPESPSEPPEEPVDRTGRQVVPFAPLSRGVHDN